MKILLVRHGETTGDIEDRYGSWYDDDLTELGASQLQETASKLSGELFEKTFSSPLKRAMQSATIINAALHTEMVVCEGLKERNYGLLGGLTKEQAILDYPEAVELHKDPANTDPEGESQNDFNQRVLETFKEITSQKYETIVIVSHGGPIKVILKNLNYPLPPRIGDGEIIEIAI